jgi:Transposase DDE domain
MQCPVVVERFRQQSQDFTRRRKLTFACVCGLILRGHKLALQNALNKVFTALGAVFQVPTASAYAHARQKLKPEVFTFLHRLLARDFYQLGADEGLVKAWRGHRLLGSDGTYLNLPDTPQTRQQFTLQSNQHEGAECVQALCCVLYDLRNELGLDLSLTKRQGEAGLLRTQLWSGTQASDVIVLDRAYAEYVLFAYAQMQQRHLVVRLPRGRFSVCEEFWQSQAPEQILELPLPQTPQTRALVEQLGLPRQLRVRLIRVVLKSGETEVLMTTLLDGVAYPAADFKQVYGWRWGEETFFDRFKNIFEVERLSGTSLSAIEQDVRGALFLASLESVLSKPDQQVLEQQAAERETRYVPQVNHAVCYLALVERVTQLLLSNQSTEQVLAELHHLFRTNPTRKRPDRQVARPPNKYAHRLRFHKYVKKLLA